MIRTQHNYQADSLRRLLMAELRCRVRRRGLWVAAAVALVLSGLAIVLMADENAWGSPAPIRLLLPPLAAGIAWLVAAWMWFSAKSPQWDRAFCQSCGFLMKGHASLPEKCPECGADPAAPTPRHARAGLLAQGPGLLMVLAGLGGFLLAMLYLMLWGVARSAYEVVSCRGDVSRRLSSARDVLGAHAALFGEPTGGWRSRGTICRVPASLSQAQLF